jgi:DNA-binding NarL/FixJ family response regulator
VLLAGKREANPHEGIVDELCQHNEPVKSVEFKGTRTSALHSHSIESYGGGDRPAVARIEATPQFTAEETILLRGLAKGNTVKQVARLLRLPRESLFRVLSDLRNKTGMLNDTALAVWALRNVGNLDRRSAER